MTRSHHPAASTSVYNLPQGQIVQEELSHTEYHSNASASFSFMSLQSSSLHSKSFLDISPNVYPFSNNPNSSYGSSHRLIPPSFSLLSLNFIPFHFVMPREAHTLLCSSVGTLKPVSFELPVLSGSDPQENMAFDLRPWRRLPNSSDEVKVTGV